MEKYNLIAEKMEKSNIHLITTLDDIAWTLNLRGNDINFNPLFFSYLIFHKKTE
jgi:Xaa-Pro aminopeptidase